MKRQHPKPAPLALTPLLLVLLALLSAFTPLSIDMYLPALPTIRARSRQHGGRTSSSPCRPSCWPRLRPDLLRSGGDRFGRRPVILCGIAVYIVTTIGCVYAVDGGQLVLLRFLQGLRRVVRSCWPHLVRDLAEREQAARAMSLIAACSSAAPMLAPLIAARCLLYGGLARDLLGAGRIGAIGLVFAWLRAAETLKPEYRQPLHLGSVVGLRHLLEARAFMGYALTSTFQFARLISVAPVRGSILQPNRVCERAKLEGAE